MLKSVNPEKTMLPAAERALPGRSEPMVITNHHFVLKDRPLKPPFPADSASIQFGMGCFWGAERRFWQREGVFTTAVGYAGGLTPNPSYEEVCSGRTGHTEVVLVVFENTRENVDALLKVFWESHDPTQGMRQGADIGTQYRSAVYTENDAQKDLVENSLAAYQLALRESGFGEISTEIKTGQTFYYAEDYHQQYLAKNPNGYCGLGGTGVCF